MTKPSKHIVFDWNGTLFDDFHALHDCTNRLLATAGEAPVAAEHLRAHYNVPFEKFYHGMGFSHAQIERMMNLENTAFHDHYEPMADQSGLRDGALPVLEAAQANSIGAFILSNHIVEAIRVQLQRLKVEHLFSDVLAYADRTTQFRDMSKGERLRRYISAHAMHPGEMIIVGDSVEEIEIAREQGLISAAITGGCVSEQRLAAAKPDHLIHSLHDLKPIMQKHGFLS